MWTRAVWLEGDKEVEGVVPDVWVKQDKVFWPPVSNATKHLKTQQQPTINWKTFRLLKVKMRSDNYDEAEDYNCTTTAETEVESGNEQIGKRKSKKRQYDDFVIDEQPFLHDSSSTVAEKPMKNTPNVNRPVHLPRPPVKVVPRQSVTLTPIRSRSNLPSSTKSIPITSTPRRSPSPLDNLPSVSQLLAGSSQASLFSSQASPASSRSRSPSILSDVSYRSHSPHLSLQHSPSLSQRSKSPQQSQRSKSPQQFQRLQSSQRSYSQRLQSPQQSQRSRSPQHSQRSHSPQQSQRSRSQQSQRSRSPQQSQRLQSSQRSYSQRLPSLQQSQRSRSPQHTHRSKSSANYRSHHSTFRRSRSPHHRSNPSPNCSSSRSHSRSHTSRASNTSRHQATYTGSKHWQDNLEDEVFPIPEARFQKRVFHMLADIRRHQQESERVLLVDDGQSVDRAESMAEFEALEASLGIPETRKGMVDLLSKVGGGNVRDIVRRVMGKLMNNHVLSHLNMKGRKDKKPFKSTALMGVVTAAVLKTPRKESITEADVATAVAHCLKYAPDRRGGTGRTIATNMT